MKVSELFRVVNNEAIEVRVPTFSELLSLQGVPRFVARHRASLLRQKNARFGDVAPLPPGIYRFPVAETPTDYPIEWRPSPNFSPRPEPRIDMLVMHYTVSSTLERTVDWFRNRDSRVSAHYVIGKDGKIVQMVRDRDKAWHAGISHWQGEPNCNNFSIGIEVVNEGEKSGIPYTPEQYRSLIFLGRRLMARYRIPLRRVLGHSDISPYRKTDPGKHFDWQLLAANGIGFLPEPAVTPGNWYGGYYLCRGDNDRAGIYGGQPAKPGNFVRELQNDLRQIGYYITRDGEFGPRTAAVVEAFQRHYLPAEVNGQVSGDTAALIKGYLRAVSL